jgi:hypothetical protein
MFKSIIAATLIATATFTTPSSAATVDECVLAGNLIELVANGRDAGVSATDMYTVMTSQNLPAEVVVQILNLVYITGADINGTTIKGVFIGACVGESA